MTCEILLGGTSIAYEVRTSSRARRLRLCMYSDGRIVITLPFRMRHEAAELFLRKKARWILTKMAFFKTVVADTHVVYTKQEYAKQKQAALAFSRERVAFFNQLYQFSYQSISVKNQKTLWGSCSRKGRLSFNYRILLLPPHVADYIVVHELCHLAQFNHSPRFWEQVRRAIPKYLECRAELKKHRLRS